MLQKLDYFFDSLVWEKSETYRVSFGRLYIVSHIYIIYLLILLQCLHLQ